MHNARPDFWHRFGHELPHGIAVLLAHGALALPLMAQISAALNEEAFDPRLAACVLLITALCSLALVTLTSSVARPGVAALLGTGLCGLLGIVHAVLTVTTAGAIFGVSAEDLFGLGAVVAFYGGFVAMPPGLVLGLFTCPAIGLAAWARTRTHRFARGASLVTSGATAVTAAGLATLLPCAPNVPAAFRTHANAICIIATVVGALVVLSGLASLVRAYASEPHE